MYIILLQERQKATVVFGVAVFTTHKKGQRKQKAEGWGILGFEDFIAMQLVGI